MWKVVLIDKILQKYEKRQNKFLNAKHSKSLI